MTPADLAALGARVIPLVWHETQGNFPSQKVWAIEGLNWTWIVQNDNGNFIWCEDVTPSWAAASPVMGVFIDLPSAMAAAEAHHVAAMSAMIEALDTGHDGRGPE